MEHRERSSAGPRIARLIAGYGTVACALPYFALKVVWLSGGTLGVTDRTMLSDASMIALNGLTAIMDLIAILMALAFTHRWGLRVPAWLVLPPTWVASGLLAKFALAVPVVTIADALTRDSPRPIAGGPVEPWVYSVVYSEFAGLGIGLMVAFVLYARIRWAFAFQSNGRAVPASATRDLQAPLAKTAALLAAAVGGLHVAWSLGFGLGRDDAAHRTLSAHLINAIDGGLMIAGAAGILMLLHRLGRRASPWLPLTLTWIGGGALFGWGSWHLINVLANTALVRDRPQPTGALFNLLGLIQLLAGLVIGLVMLFHLAETRPAVGAD